MLDRDSAAFIQTGVAISLAACGADRMPNNARALGCKLVDGQQRVAIFMRLSQTHALVANIRENGLVAAVFSLPSSNRTLQLKGSDAQVVDFDHADLMLIERHTEAFLREVLPEGISELAVRTIHDWSPDDMLTVVFTPSAAFSQTPGPRAGQPLGSRP
ncbi:pyridoxamine 5'-phosphate oxidase family protein [Accumulibacter sp.]|uniref:pyridoxamine 5'-phosphate oxidase family protein n=1 Tax=Accumulibacter sp. TaxID=2053492 RepID=UPI0025CEC1E1|nr:pyridoxamine 5'-phosphate oxidase family protein [Accumulibacter sp.]MCP5227156.1 pyridoxamine 5'-phosphate oxidase family protein [Accumulibacter sp.]